MLSEWPTPSIKHSQIAASNFERLQKLITEARYVISELPGQRRYSLLYQTDSLIEDNIELIRHLARLENITHVDQARGLRLAASGREAWLDIDADTLYQHQHNLELRLAETRQYIANLSARLSNENYVSKAPAHLVEETKQELENKQALEERLRRELEVLN